MEEINYQEGMIALENRKYSDAIVCFTKSLKHEKKLSAYGNRAYAHMQLGEFDLAKSDYESQIKIINEYLNQADKNDKAYIDLCIRDLIEAIAPIAYIELERQNFIIAINLNTELINLYNSMTNNKILNYDKHISNFHVNRGVAYLNIGNTNNAAIDLGNGYVETICQDNRKKILEFAESIGLLDKVKYTIANYSFEKSNTEKNKDLEFTFISSDHIRYENNKQVSGPHGSARRAIKVESNMNGYEGYTVTLYNLDGKHPIWQNNLQMAPKQMKIHSIGEDKIILHGYGEDSMGGSFSDYGLTINLDQGEIANCILHLYDRNVDIVYMR